MSLAAPIFMPYTPPQSPQPAYRWLKRSTLAPHSPEDSGESDAEADTLPHHPRAHTKPPMTHDVDMETDEESEPGCQERSAFLRLPIEIIDKVLTSFGDHDNISLARFAMTCQELRAHIYLDPDQSLWRDIFLQNYDDPRKAAAPWENAHTEDIDWRQKVKDREFVFRVLDLWQEEKWDEAIRHLDLICDTLLDMYLDLPSTAEDECQHHQDSPRPYRPRASKNTPILTYLCSSPLFIHLYRNHRLCPQSPGHPRLRPLAGARQIPQWSVRRQIRTHTNPKLARLHTLLPPHFDENDEADREWRGFMRELVYSIKGFSEANDHGPFHADGTVDWVICDAVGSVMMSNADEVMDNPEISEHWRDSIVPRSYGVEPTRGWGFSHVERPLELPSTQVWDWAGVEGTWEGSYAFIDYTDWISLNEPQLILQRGRVAQLDLTRYHEAVGDLMRLRLVLDDPTDPNSPTHHLPHIVSNLPVSNALPPIRFVGASLSSNDVEHPSPPLGFVRGTVQLTTDNPPQVRWTLVIRYGGADRWTLEAVQMGGRGSKRGFFGIWTDAAKEAHTPNGPLWYWKS
ncbi:hypothetical protein L202_05466 [Cryptococcus amylolentus CBS 6039]|uniref:F-box domain-containing protein n=1 Tax=Cryptococcus amylolentus CBS 6039 TaxID=1295533 RepID=A0A1E3HKM5_9TREE|nr:hypothetical protein L202_05466 [Cryptococcus amylolentus CBS 6039]ODN76879.1 hypothetical protein L202_05466 [Cryptococcus amylolentus CBS 6039]